MSTRTALVTVMLVTALAVASAGQPNQDSALARRVDVLDAMVASLQKRVSLLEGQATSRTPAATLAVPAGKEAWRRLTKGMAMQDVRSILGEPQRIEGGFWTHWYYRGGKVTFGNDNRLYGWDEPY